MPSTNGHGPETAILYARVSGEERAKKGYSLLDQKQGLRKWAAEEGHKVIEEIEDDGWSGAYLERPGLDRVRDMVAAGGVGVVAVLFRDRLARGLFAGLLKAEFAEHGTKLVALNAQTDDSPEGELHEGILDQFAAYERAKIAERTRRGKLQKARQGKVLATSAPDYGFRYNAARDGYEIDKEKMSVVRRIFRMVGVEGMTLHAVKVALQRDGVQSPGGKRYWNEVFLRECILDDVYQPHSFEEVKELVSTDVAARLDPKCPYGIWWFNRRRTRRTPIAENGTDGRTYRRRSTTVIKPREEWIAVPVPDAGIPRAWVDAARQAISTNKSTSSAGRRFWELSGGILYCAGCGRRMLTHAVTSGRMEKNGRPRERRRYFYYVCSKVMDHGKDACPNNKSTRALDLERLVWEKVSGLLKDPVRIRLGYDALINEKREALRGDPEHAAKVWLGKMAEAERMRGGYQELAAKGLMTFDELEAKLAELEETRKAAQRELEALDSRREEIEELERCRDNLLDSFVPMVTEGIDLWTPEDRNRAYKMLRLEAMVGPDGFLEIRLAIRTDLSVLELETVPVSCRLVTHFVTL
jgi:site-specific DNA recombinase